MRIRSWALFAFLCLLPFHTFAQAAGTGLYQFGSFDNRGFDSINIGNLNIHFEIPIVNKPGRGLHFQYSLVYDGLIWQPSSSSGSTVWSPDPEWGIHGQLSDRIMGYLSYQYTLIKCIDTPPHYTMTPRLSNYVYHDGYGQQHAFKFIRDICNNIGTDGTPMFAKDSSGYSFDGNVIIDRHGNVINVPKVAASVTTATNAGTITDTNGNFIAYDGSNAFTDTLGATALALGGGGNASSPRTFTYKVAQQADSSTTATASMSYSTYTVRTNFSCSGIGEYGPQSIDLPDRITLADGTYYQFAYESTPGYSGNVTGRLASVTLPTGGTISYQYQYGCGNGLNADGTTGSLNRVTSDGTRSYGRSPLTNGSRTTLQDEAGRQTIYDFVSANGSYYATHKQVFDGNTNAANLLDQYTCYNGTIPCSGTAITLPITSVQNVISHNNGAQYQTQDSYDGPSGLLLTHSDYDYGNALLQTASYSYNSLGEVTQAVVKDGNNNQISKATYGYDENSLQSTSGIPQHNAVSGTRGNLTSSTVWINSSTTLSASNISYYDTGVPVSSTDPNGTTQYSYDSTQGFATQITPPTPLSGVSLPMTASYDANSGIQLSGSDANNTGTPMVQYSQYDKLLRPKQVNTVDGATISYNYGMYQNFHTFDILTPTGGDTSTLYDPYGRISRVAVYNGQATNGWYVTDYCYDVTGKLQFLSAKYQGTGFDATKQCSGTGITYSYDALGRVTNIKNADGNIQYQYNSRAVKVTDVNGVQKITQYDALGRISKVCEVSGSPYQGDSPQDCQSDITGSGYLTTYSYDLANHKTTITQGVQTRVFQTDALGRLTNVSEPERGTTTYSYAYNSTGLQVTRTRPKANQGDVNTKTNTVTQYDKVGRVVTVSYNDGLTPGKYYFYDVALNWPSASSATNVKGRLAMTSTSSSTGSMFSYDSMGRVKVMWQCAPSICPSAQESRPALQFSYDLAGNLTSEFDGASGQIAYGRSPAGEVTSITNLNYADTVNPPHLVSNVVNGPFGPTSYTLGNGLAVVYQYDSTGRNIGNWLCNNGSTQVDCGNGNASTVFLSGSQISGNRLSWQCETVMGCHDYPHDDLDRLHVNESFGTVNGTYSYDRYGNRWQQTSPQGGPAPSYSFDTATNRINGLGYDAAGNMTNDGFHSYTYDAEGKVLQVDGGSTGQYVYDALDHRVRTQNANATYEYLYDYAGHRLSSWLEPSNFGNEGRIYWNDRQIAYRAWNGQTYFEHKDVTGTERMRTNYAGSIASTYASLPWGDGYAAYETDPAGDGLDNLHFAQLDKDSESNTEHAMYRQYSSTQGRWLSPDPYDGSYDMSDPQSFNRYSYVRNRPLSSLDPLGMSDCESGWWVSGGGEWCDNEYGGGVTVTADPPDDFAPYYPDPSAGGDPARDNGSGSGSSTPTAPAPSNTNCSATPSLWPHGIAGVVGGEGTLGLSKLGATAQGSAGFGLFGGKPGGFLSYVATAVAGFHNPGAPHQQGGTNPIIFGAGLGAGLGGMITNATSVQQTRGTFQQFTLSLPAVSFSFAYGGGIWTVNVTAGPGLAVATTSTTTNTKVKGPC